MGFPKVMRDMEKLLIVWDCPVPCGAPGILSLCLPNCVPTVMWKWKPPPRFLHHPQFLRTAALARLSPLCSECALPFWNCIDLLMLWKISHFENASSVSIFWSLTHLSSLDGTYPIKLSFRRDVCQSEILQHSGCNTLQLLKQTASCQFFICRYYLIFQLLRSWRIQTIMGGYISRCF